MKILVSDYDYWLSVCDIAESNLQATRTKHKEWFEKQSWWYKLWHKDPKPASENMCISNLSTYDLYEADIRLLRRALYIGNADGIIVDESDISGIMYWYNGGNNGEIRRSY